MCTLCPWLDGRVTLLPVQFLPVFFRCQVILHCIQYSTNEIVAHAQFSIFPAKSANTLRQVNVR